MFAALFIVFVLLGVSGPTMELTTGIYRFSIFAGIKKNGEILCWPVGMSVIPLRIFLTDKKQVAKYTFGFQFCKSNPKPWGGGVSELSFCKRRSGGLLALLAVFSSGGREQNGRGLGKLIILLLFFRMVLHGTVSKCTVL